MYTGVNYKRCICMQVWMLTGVIVYRCVVYRGDKEKQQLSMEIESMSSFLDAATKAKVGNVLRCTKGYVMY